MRDAVEYLEQNFVYPADGSLVVSQKRVALDCRESQCKRLQQDVEQAVSSNGSVQNVTSDLQVTIPATAESAGTIIRAVLRGGKPDVEGFHAGAAAVQQ